VDSNDQSVALDAVLVRYSTSDTVAVLKNVRFKAMTPRVGVAGTAYYVDMDSDQTFKTKTGHTIVFRKPGFDLDYLDTGALTVLFTIDGQGMDRERSVTVPAGFGRTEFTLRTPLTYDLIHTTDAGTVVGGEFGKGGIEVTVTSAHLKAGTTLPAIATTFPITIRERRPIQRIPVHFMVRWEDLRGPMSQGWEEKHFGRYEY
jgi:hypothetical protein